jgi:hypothetical protein
MANRFMGIMFGVLAAFVVLLVAEAAVIVPDDLAEVDIAFSVDPEEHHFDSDKKA